MATPLIEFRNVTKRFGDRTILDGVDLSIFEGEITTIIGKSGTGKSVLLKHIIGLLTPDTGTILFQGRDIGNLNKKDRNAYRGQISYMFQNNALFDSLTVFENIALPLRQTTNLPKPEIEKMVMARIEQAELNEVVHHYPSELSGGMQKRVALARALVTNPDIVLFDEPTTGQDPIRKNAILTMIAEYQRKFRFTAVMISHELPDVYFISDRILALYDGKIIFQGTPEDFEELDHPFRDEIVDSLEGLQEELTGLYSRRHFKVRYQTDLTRKDAQGTYAAVIFSLEDMEVIIENLGHDAAQKVIRTLGAYINKHFGAVGGFSSRQTFNEIGTILPFSDIDEAKNILDDFTQDFQQQGLCDLQAEFEIPETECFEFTVLAGLSQGKPQIELESVMEFARFNQEEIARFQCERRR
jgi:phospholipid/cholesterol/gamma-HCH transport system ATP-binding protein